MKPHMLTLSLPALTELDGGAVAEAWLELAQQAVADLHNRPQLKDKRKVTLTVEFSPVPDKSGELIEVTTAFKLKSSLPTSASRDFRLSPAKDNLLKFGLFNPDDPSQLTLEEAAARKDAGPRPIKEA